MTIEIAPAATNTKVASSSGPSGTKAKPGSTESGQATKSSGFMAILAAADESTTGDLLSSDGMGSDAPLVPLGGGVDTAVASNGVDAVTDAAALLTQALQWTVNPMGVPNNTTLDPTTVNSDAAIPDPAIASVTGAAPGFGAMARQSLPTVKTDGLAGDAALNRVAVGDARLATGDAAGLPRKVGKDVKDTAALQSPTVANVGNPAAEAGRTDDRSLKFMAHEMGLKTEMVKSEPVLQSVAATAKREEQSVHGAAKASAAMEVAASWGGTGGAVGGSAVYSVAPVADAGALTSAYVAEQVSYWISNDVQSAEIKLQGLGDSPVEVRISMVGNEAHVAFRTDEAQARDALENASAHLKEMLQRDGVVLSGVSVGTSGAGGAGGQESQPRQGRQRATVAVEVPTRSTARAWGTAQTGRALDLFV